ncbi:hypothetical protein EBU71_11240 [bacterium]|nr:hypothetical protein [Candidatus Elulimicrobium humile]
MINKNTSKVQVRTPNKTRRRTVSEAPPPTSSEDENKEEIEESEDETSDPSELEKLKSKVIKKQEPESDTDSPSVKESDAFSDRFLLKVEGIESFRVKNVELPKIIFSQHKNIQSIKEKSTIMVYFYTIPHETEGYPWKSLFQAAKKNNIKCAIDWIDEKEKVVSEWVFNKARIQGLDLGNAAYEKPAPSEGAIEISYESINIDGVEF